jgi:hypothetical protein
VHVVLTTRFMRQIGARGGMNSRKKSRQKIHKENRQRSGIDSLARVNGSGARSNPCKQLPAEQHADEGARIKPGIS